MGKKPAQPQFIALVDFVGAVKGANVSVRRGDRFRATDPIVANWPELFRKATTIAP